MPDCAAASAEAEGNGVLCLVNVGRRTLAVDVAVLTGTAAFGGKVKRTSVDFGAGAGAGALVGLEAAAREGAGVLKSNWIGAETLDELADLEGFDDAFEPMSPNIEDTDDIDEADDVFFCIDEVEDLGFGAGAGVGEPKIEVAETALVSCLGEEEVRLPDSIAA